ncbi:MAG: hypothetical protein M0Q48_03615, partial [Verrucomicrobia bacterium]|nr:hypothetical protein [Verrucomicrobiota bacterium]
MSVIVLEHPIKVFYDLSNIKLKLTNKWSKSHIQRNVVLPQKYAHRKGEDVGVEKGGCLKKNALKHMYVSEYEHGSNKRV